eukprot:6263533-Amphidinium_carterae.1
MQSAGAARPLAVLALSGPKFPAQFLRTAQCRLPASPGSPSLATHATPTYRCGTQRHVERSKSVDHSLGRAITLQSCHLFSGLARRSKQHCSKVVSGLAWK